MATRATLPIVFIVLQITDHLNKSLTGWFAHCDHPTAADFQMFFALEALRIRVPDAGHAIEEYVKRVKERPAYKRVSNSTFMSISINRAGIL